MKAISRRLILIFAMLLFAASADAQWNIVAPKMLGINSGFGAIQYRDGVVWAGYQGLWSSIDSGMTWQNVKNFPSGTITDIAFYDKLTGLVCLADKGGVYLTTDGGKSWAKTLVGPIYIDFRKIGFNGSAKVMHALNFGGIFYSSIDGGNTWYSSNVGSKTQTRSFAVANDGTVYVFSSLDPSDSLSYGEVVSSTDLGRSWSGSGQTIDDDCFTLSVDSCDPKRLYLVNEQKESPTSDSIARLYLSTDGGSSWQTEASHDNRPPPHYYYSGSMSTTRYSVFVGTDSSSGALRSTDFGMTWTSIGGPAESIDSRLIAAIDDNIILSADSEGNIWLTRNSGGDSLPAHPPQVLTISPASLFATDTIHCDSIVRGVTIIRSGCFAPYAGAASIIGPGSASYRIISSDGSADSVILLPNSTGAMNASLVIHLSDGDTTIPLSGFSAATPFKYSFTPTSLFQTDTVECDSIIETVNISRTGCYGDSISGVTIAGPDSASYQILSSDSDSIAVRFISNSLGSNNAWLLLNLSDGTSDFLPLYGYCKTATWSAIPTPDSLFNTDTLWICEPPAVDTIIINASACRFPNVTSEHISGPDSADYSITRGITQPFSDFDTVIVTFSPSDTGALTGKYEVTLDNGKVISVPLGGHRYFPQPLTLTTANAANDTIGGTVYIPIVISGLVRAEDIDIVLNYDTRLEYENSFDLSGVEADIPGQQWAGRSELHLPNAIPGTTQGYATFNVWSDTAGQPIVTFDSIAVLSEVAPCEYILPKPDTSVITPITGCDEEILSKFVHLGQSPVFSVQPNPSTGDVFISSDMDIGDVTVAVYDMLGSERVKTAATITKVSPAHISLPDAAGVYYIRIFFSTWIENMNVVVTR